MTIPSIAKLLAIVIPLLSAAPSLHAQSYPANPINLVIPLAPGDAGDVSGRTMGEELSKLLKVPVVPVNRAGGGLTIGTDNVAKAKKDGYTILLTTNAPLITTRILHPDTVPYDPFKDLTPLALAARTPIILGVRGDAPFKNLADLIEFSKKNPGKVRVGTVGAGSIGHFTVEIINSLTGAGMTMVPFKGGAPAITALLGGHVEAAALAVGAVAPHLKSGAMKGMVISSKFPALPEVPTLTELGHKQNLLGVWFAFFAPAGVPADVVKALGPAIEKVVKDPAIGSKLAALGIVTEYGPPERVLAEMREEQRVTEEIAKRAGLVK